VDSLPERDKQEIRQAYAARRKELVSILAGSIKTISSEEEAQR